VKWRFDNDAVGHKWVEAEFVPNATLTEHECPPRGFVDLVRATDDIPVGARDMENDFVVESDRETFLDFSRREYHSSGLFPSLAKRRWGCYSTEESLRAVMKQLDSRDYREKELKERLKESLERTFGPGEKVEVIDSLAAEEPEDNDAKDAVRTCGDEKFFTELTESDDLDKEIINQICLDCKSGIGAAVRVRIVISASKGSQTARYENGTVNAWKLQHEETQTEHPHDANDKMIVIDRPYWRVHSEKGTVIWLDHIQLFESIDRYTKWSKKQGGYFEYDATFLAYRNNLGRFCGKAADAAYAASPFYFAKLMMKREAEIYPKLKIRSYDNNWGGQSGARALWINSMKDYAYEFNTVLQGLLTLENAFFELTKKFDSYQNLPNTSDIDGTEVLTNPAKRGDMDLESIEKNIVGLWNSPSSRAFYLEIVKGSKTTGMLALALDLLVRNTMKYLQNSKTVSSTRSSRSNNLTTDATSSSTNNYNNYSVRPVRSTRRMNAWQQQQQQQDFDDSYNDDQDSDEDWR
jgi:Williams-Beuren syndrome DDT (WSD), D-TOX E motif